MMTPEEIHRDVGAYALGILNPRDSARFEDHLMVCRSCPRELAELSSVAALLSQVDAESLVFAEYSGRDPGRAEALVSAVRTDRRRARSRRALTLAACLAFLIAGAFAAVGLGLRPVGLPGPQPLTAAAQKLHAIDRFTGTEATVQLAPKRWGSQVTLQVARVDGPVRCRLVAVSKTGQSEVVMGWSVPPGGYGTATQPDPLVLHGGTDLQPGDVSRLEIRTVNGNLLVSVPA
ncbi:zf-HC2 domain-containing protein [Planosporangium flavigriseum]|uniref:RNA polymerase subunit sigma n=1 Tax=Planosporangium flavigriseum TaxID=373681 RepID=A0A8J3LZY9_9ACTN|nr:zf-HC2 domain-containing protein [Planosporangium flavigriseum]NJC67958.1 zf-HC2 domain-containing protein [Planosporangium flavigriseum]GIG76566.1 RNA polymerase subunit sigma [Planosporangium flavigriseum]